jgi:cytochrome c553
MTKTSLFIGLVLALAGSTCLAKGDAQKGKALAYTCTGCHGIPEYKNAYPSYHVPKIAGQNEAYIVMRSPPTRKASASIRPWLRRPKASAPRISLTSPPMFPR